MLWSWTKLYPGCLSIEGVAPERVSGGWLKGAEMIGASAAIGVGVLVGDHKLAPSAAQEADEAGFGVDCLLPTG